MQSSTLPYLPFLKQGQAHYTFTSAKEERRIYYPLNWKSKNLIYLTECKKKCGKQYLGETKCYLHQSFGEHRRSIVSHGHFPKKSFSRIRTF